MAEVQPKKIGVGSYIIAGLGLIPGIGIIFALIALFLGFVKRPSGGNKLIIMGCLGIILTVVTCGPVYYQAFMVRGGKSDELRTAIAKQNLVDLVKSLEQYKASHSQYPDTLTELLPTLDKDTGISIYDSTLMTGLEGLGLQPTPTFFYQLTEDRTHYYLLGIGADQKPFTSDDLLPEMTEQDRAKTGLLINPASLSSQR